MCGLESVCNGNLDYCDAYKIKKIICFRAKKVDYLNPLSSTDWKCNSSNILIIKPDLRFDFEKIVIGCESFEQSKKIENADSFIVKGSCWIRFSLLKKSNPKENYFNTAAFADSVAKALVYSLMPIVTSAIMWTILWRCIKKEERERSSNPVIYSTNRSSTSTNNTSDSSSYNESSNRSSINESFKFDDLPPSYSLLNLVQNECIPNKSNQNDLIDASNSKSAVSNGHE